MQLLGLISGENSEKEDESDIDDPVEDATQKLPQEEQEPSSSEEDSSGCEDPIPQPFEPVRGRKRHRDKYEGYCSDGDIGRSHTVSQTKQDEAGVSSNVPEEATTGPSNEEQSKKGCGM